MEAAQVHVRKANAASDLGNFVEAAREYEAAYMMTSDANLLVNVGQAWQRAGDPQKALTAFHSYVRVAPNGDQRFLCEVKIRELEDQSRAQPSAVPLPSPMAPPAPYVAYPPPAPAFAPPQGSATAAADPSPFYDHWPFWAAFTAAVAGGVIAGVLWARQSTEVAMPTTTFGTKQY